MGKFKRRLLLTVLLLIAVIFTVRNTACIKFQGIPVRGNYIEFCNRLKKAGYTPYDESDPENQLFHGPFLNLQNVMISVLKNDVTGDVCKVVATIDVADTWESAYRSYQEISNVYKEKYGNPDEQKTIEEGATDSLKLAAVTESGSNCYTNWEVHGGAIETSIVNVMDNIYVKVSYFRKFSRKEIRHENNGM